MRFLQEPPIGNTEITMDHSQIDAEDAGDHTRTVERRIGIPHELTRSSLSLSCAPSTLSVLSLSKWRNPMILRVRARVLHWSFWGTHALLVNPAGLDRMAARTKDRKGRHRETRRRWGEKRGREAGGHRNRWIVESRVGYPDCPRSGHFPRYA